MGAFTQTKPTYLDQANEGTILSAATHPSITCCSAGEPIPGKSHYAKNALTTFATCAAGPVRTRAPGDQSIKAIPEPYLGMDMYFGPDLAWFRYDAQEQTFCRNSQGYIYVFSTSPLSTYIATPDGFHVIAMLSAQDQPDCHYAQRYAARLIFSDKMTINQTCS
jgi:hypothetical protein